MRRSYPSVILTASQKIPSVTAKSRGEITREAMSAPRELEWRPAMVCMAVKMTARAASPVFASSRRPKEVEASPPKVKPRRGQAIAAPEMAISVQAATDATAKARPVRDISPRKVGRSRVRAAITATIARTIMPPSQKAAATR